MAANIAATSLAGLLNKPTLKSTSPKDIVTFLDQYDLYKGNLPDGEALSVTTCIGSTLWRSLERVAMARDFLDDRDDDLPLGMSEDEIRHLLEQCATSLTGNSALSRIQRLKPFDVKMDDKRMDALLETYELALKDARDQGMEWRELFPAFKRTVIKDNVYLADEFKAKEHSFTSVKRVTSFLYKSYLTYKKSVEVVRMMSPDAFKKATTTTQQPGAKDAPTKNNSKPNNPTTGTTSTVTRGRYGCWGCGERTHRLSACPTFTVDTEGNIKAKTGDAKPKRERLFIKKEPGAAGIHPTVSMPVFTSTVGPENVTVDFYLDSGSSVSVLASSDG